MSNEVKKSFLQSAMEIEGVLSASESIKEVTRLDDEFIDAKACMRIQSDAHEDRMITTERVCVVGGLVYDSDSECPQKAMDGEGHIYHAPGRRSDKTEASQYLDALGLDENGDPDVDDDRVEGIAADMATKFINDEIHVLIGLCDALAPSGGPRLTFSAVNERLSTRFQQNPVEDAIQSLVKMLPARTGRALATFAEGLKNRATEKLLMEEGSGNPLAVVLDVYEHSGVHYSIKGTGMQCRWDTSRGGAVWVPCDCAKENIESSARTKMLAEGLDPTDRVKFMAACVTAAEAYCKGCLETYNSWANGQVYGVVVYVIDRESGDVISDFDDECWGFYGHEYAEEALEEAMLSVTRHALKKWAEMTAEA